MAKYDVTFSCGHAGRVDLIGPHSSRERKIEYFETEGLCPECRKKAQEAEKAAAEEAKSKANASAKEEAEKFGFSELTDGTAKQIAFCYYLRSEFLARFIERFDKYAASHFSEEFRQMAYDMFIEHIKENYKTCKDIFNKGKFFSAEVSCDDVIYKQIVKAVYAAEEAAKAAAKAEKAVTETEKAAEEAEKAVTEAEKAAEEAAKVAAEAEKAAAEAAKAAAEAAKVAAEIAAKEAEIKEQIAALRNELKTFKAAKMAEYKAALAEIKERRISEAKEAAAEEEAAISAAGAEKREAKKAIKAALKIKISGIKEACKPMGITKLLAKYSAAANSSSEE